MKNGYLIIFSWLYDLIANDVVNPKFHFFQLSYFCYTFQLTNMNIPGGLEHTINIKMHSAQV